LRFPRLAPELITAYWKSEWPRIDFTKFSIDYGDVLSGGPPRGGNRRLTFGTGGSNAISECVRKWTRRTV